MSEAGEFYVGYFSHAPKATGVFLRKLIVFLFAGLICLAAFIAYCQEKIDIGNFAFGNKLKYQGSLFEAPIPMLRTLDRTYILVGDGKFGADEFVKKLRARAQGSTVEIEGTLIERQPIAMLEVAGDSEPKVLDTPALAELPSESLGDVSLQGELVDSKCYLGVMRPATGKVHRGCAIRCLSGGVPPGVLIRNTRVDSSILVLLSDAQGGRVSFQPEWAGRTIKAKGALKIIAGYPVLYGTIEP